MSLKEEVDILRNIPLFGKIEAAKLKLLAFASERLTYHADQVLFHQGDPGDSAYIILSGEAEVIIDGPDGPLVIAKLARNAIVGEIAILCDVPRTATVKAKSELVTLRIAKELFFRLITEFPQMGIEIMRVLADRLERTNNQLRAAVSQAAHR
ncbi:MAG: cyclic nucleotide-binding domain-containing protein [Alphaproteobacteria bacterium]